MTVPGPAAPHPTAAGVTPSRRSGAPAARQRHRDRLRTQLRRGSTRRFLLLLAILAGLGLITAVAPVPAADELPALVDRLGGYAPVAAIGVAALLMVALVPRTVLTVAWGALFGFWQGALYTLAAALIAAIVAFTAGRLLGRAFMTERSAGRLARLDRWFTRQSLAGVLTVRLLPLGGFGLISYGYGTTGVRPGPFLLGSIVAIMPSAFGYAAVGAAVTAPGGIDWFAAAPAALGLLLGAVLVHRAWRARRPGAGPEQDGATPAVADGCSPAPAPAPTAHRSPA